MDKKELEKLRHLSPEERIRKLKELEDKKKFLDSAIQILKAMDLLFYNCNDKFEVAKMFYPDVDDWSWSSPKVIEARKKIWGM